MRISARNQFTGRIVDIKLDGNTAKVVVKITDPTEVTAIITRDSAEELGLKKGDTVRTIVKSTEVMIGKE